MLDEWELVALDLADIGIDVWDRQLMRSRPGVWLRSLLTGLLTRPVVAWREVRVDDKHVRIEPVWPNRVQARFNTPKK